MEDKRRFVKRINEALVECGDGRYDRLKSEPLTYLRTECGAEYVTDGRTRVCVDGDSLPALMRDIRPLL